MAAPYESKITFTLDTICPWTYLGKKKLDQALNNYASSTNIHQPVNFTLQFAPYQLYPDNTTPAGQNKRDWFVANKFSQDADKMSQFEAVMDSYGSPLDIKFSWDGEIANTLNAHRVILFFQGSAPDSDPDEDEDDEDGGRKAALDRWTKYGPAVASKIVNALYRMYFEEAQHPSTAETLSKACVEAGIPDDEAKRVAGDEVVGLAKAKRKIRMSKSDGVDSVPTVVFEGRRRDLTLIGAKETAEYEKALAQIVKEST